MVSNRLRVPPFFSRSSRQELFGLEVPIGLTFADTREFKLLEAESPIDERGCIPRWGADGSLPPNQARRLELDKRHQAACATRRGSAMEVVGRTLRGTHTRSSRGTIFQL
jgi:hypothetical protein